MAKNSSKPSSLLKFRDRKSSFTNSTTPITSNNSTTEQQSKPAKKYLRDTSLNQILNEIIISLCQKYMEINIKKRLIYYTILVLIGSMLCDSTPGLIRALFPFKTEKDHFFNQYFVKIGWFWTLVLLIPFQILTRKTIKNQLEWYNVKDLLRIILTTLIWYFSINFFNYIEVQTGKCSQMSIKSRSNCLRKGWNWIGFDISGHTFLLLFSILILIEESKVINGFENFGYLLDNKWQESNKQFKHYDLYMKYLVPIRLLYVSITFLSLLWDFMLIQTILHYHNLVQKIIAFLWSLGSWYLCYYIIFPSNFLNFLRMPLRTPTELKEK